MTDFFVAPDQMHIEVDDDSLSLYQFGKKIAQHTFCKKCGIYPFHLTRSRLGYFRINAGCIDGIDSLSLPYDVFDGASKL